MWKKFIANNRTHILCSYEKAEEEEGKKSFCRWEFLIRYDVYMAKVEGIFQYVASCLKEIYCRFCCVQLLLQYYFLFLIPKNIYIFLTFHHKKISFVCFMPSNHHFLGLHSVPFIQQKVLSIYLWVHVRKIKYI
jgi:hypothetical protein